MNKPVRWNRIVLLCAVVLIAFLIGRSQLASSLEEVRAREASLQVSLTRLQRTQSGLQADLELVGTSGYIETRARTDYSFLKPGELRFEIVNPDCLEGYTEAEMKILMQEIQVNVY